MNATMVSTLTAMQTRPVSMYLAAIAVNVGKDLLGTENTAKVRTQLFIYQSVHYNGTRLISFPVNKFNGCWSFC